MQTGKRLLSLDIFRGMTIAGMILVNNPGSWSKVYPPLLHAEWHGVTPTDWVFPFFLFIVGVSISLALGKRKEQAVPNRQLGRKIITRTLIIFGLGLFLASFPNFGFSASGLSSIKTINYILLALVALAIFYRALIDQKQFESPQNTQLKKWLFIGAGIAVLLMLILGFQYYSLANLRIPGVLQRIALVYGACAFLFLYTNPKQQLLVGIGLLLFYWFLMFVVPVPGGIAPNLEAETNLGAWLDRAIFSSDHLWRQAKTWDPEGLLSTLPAIVNGISGMLTGWWLRQDKPAYEKISGMLAVGVLILTLSFIWNLNFPFNKKIWSSSFVLYTSGVALLFLGTVYWLVDEKGYKGWIRPFQIFGMNALFAYILSSGFAKLTGLIRWQTAAGDTMSVRGWLYQNFFTSWLPDYNASLAFAIFNVLFVFFFCWILYKKKIYIKV